MASGLKLSEIASRSRASQEAAPGEQDVSGVLKLAFVFFIIILAELEVMSCRFFLVSN